MIYLLEIVSFYFNYSMRTAHVFKVPNYNVYMALATMAVNTYSVDHLLQNTARTRTKLIVTDHILAFQDELTSILRLYEEGLQDVIFSGEGFDVEQIQGLWVLRELISKYGGEPNFEDDKATLFRGHTSAWGALECENDHAQPQAELLREFCISNTYSGGDRFIAAISEDTSIAEIVNTQMSDTASRLYWGPMFLQSLTLTPTRDITSELMISQGIYAASVLLPELEIVVTNIYEDAQALRDYFFMEVEKIPGLRAQRFTNKLANVHVRIYDLFRKYQIHIMDMPSIFQVVGPEYELAEHQFPETLFGFEKARAQLERYKLCPQLEYTQSVEVGEGTRSYVAAVTRKLFEKPKPKQKSV